MLRQALIVIITAVLFKSFLEYWFGPRVDDVTKQTVEENKIKVFSPKDLESQNDQLYLAILGSLLNTLIY